MSGTLPDPTVPEEHNEELTPDPWQLHPVRTLRAKKKKASSKKAAKAVKRSKPLKAAKSKKTASKPKAKKKAVARRSKR
jgi:hypothetical protein